MIIDDIRKRLADAIRAYEASVGSIATVHRYDLNGCTSNGWSIAMCGSALDGINGSIGTINNESVTCESCTLLMFARTP